MDNINAYLIVKAYVNIIYATCLRIYCCELECFQKSTKMRLKFIPMWKDLCTLSASFRSNTSGPFLMNPSLCCFLENNHAKDFIAHPVDKFYSTTKSTKTTK